MRLTSCAFLLAVTGVAAGCTFSGSKGKPAADASRDLAGTDTAPGQTYGSLRVEPAEATLDLASGAKTAQFEAFGTLNGVESNITDKVTWTTDDALAATAAPGGLVTATGKLGGLITVRAASGTGAATARLNIKLTATTTNPADPDPVPPATQGKLPGATEDASLAPQLVYPNDGVLMPPNLNRMEVHFRPGPATNTVFEIAMTSPYTDVRVYTHCVQADLPEGCLYELAGDTWQQVAMSNRGRGAVTITVRGSDDTADRAGTSAAVKMVFVKEPLRGAVYYWTITPGKSDSQIMRWDFGNPKQTTPEAVIPMSSTGNTCVGCHALSRDGKKIVASVGGQADARVVLWDVQKNAPLIPFPAPTKSQFESWNPDGTQYVGIGQANAYTGSKPLRLYDGNTAQQIGEISVDEMRPDHPDWSPDGNTIAFTFVDPTARITDQRPRNGGIAFVNRDDPDASGTAWSTPTIVVDRDPAQVKNRYYPAIDPESKLVVFNESTCKSGDTKSCDCDSDPSARLFVAPLQAGAAPVELVRANAPGLTDTGTDLTTSYAKWAPFVFSMAEEGKIEWITVSSARMYGLRPPRPTPNGDESKTGTYVWMFAFDPRSPGDPSFPPFVLPFQDIKKSNHIAQWTTEVPIIIP